MKLKKDDTVKIIAGKDKGKTGRILRVNNDAGKVIVQGLNMVKKSMKPKSQNDKGGIIDIEAAKPFLRHRRRRGIPTGGGAPAEFRHACPAISVCWPERT